MLLADRLYQAMALAERRATQVAVAYLDLDGFKAINDRHGHAMGDRLLADLATRLKLVLREGDTIARMGGDEFVAVFVDLAGAQDSLTLVDRLLEVASQTTVLDGVTLKGISQHGGELLPASRRHRQISCARPTKPCMAPNSQAKTATNCLTTSTTARCGSEMSPSGASARRWHSRNLCCITSPKSTCARVR